MRVETGEIELITSPAPEWASEGANGICTFTSRSEFRKPFESVPSVTVGLAGLDIVPGNGRVTVETELIAVDTSGFEVKLTSRTDQLIESARANWFAVGS
jgi:hypothetical protein